MAMPATHSPTEQDERPITFEEYQALPESNLRHELILGEIVTSLAPRASHQRALLRLAMAMAMANHAEEQASGEVLAGPLDVRFTAHTAVKPDIIYVSSERQAIINDAYIDGPPDLLVEVLAPETRRTDLVVKRAVYADRGVREYWIVDPMKRTVSINAVKNGALCETLVESGVAASSFLPGFEIEIAEMFNIPAWMTKTATDQMNEEQPRNDV